MNSNPAPPLDTPGAADAQTNSPGFGQRGLIQSCRFEQLPGDFTSCTMPPGNALPDWVGGMFFSFCRGVSETSILCATELVPSQVSGDREWQLFHVFSKPGLLPADFFAAFVSPLKARQIEVITAAGSRGVCFLVRRHALPAALKTLQEAGHHFEARAGVESIPVAFLAT